MKVIQISDLHIDSHFMLSNYQDMLNKMLECIRNDMVDEERIYILCCGDIVNKGNADEYIGKAKAFFDFIIDNMKGKEIELLFVPGNHDLCATSNRAIIPLVRFSDVLDKQFGHLPGLNSIQFGFLNDEKADLFCSVYLRSLEVNHFFKINLSEIYLLLMQIFNEIRSVKRLIINIYAFKAQYKEKFSCFRKAKIDTLNVGTLSKFVYQRDILEIVSLLRDKFDMEETVINTTGLTNFYDILKASELYNEKIISGLSEIIREMENLKQEYMKSSNYEEIKPIEERIHKKQERYIELVSNIEA